MLIKRSEKKFNILSVLGITPLVLRTNKRVPLHVLSYNSKDVSNIKICVIQIKSESDGAPHTKSYSILEDAMRAINFEIQSEQFLLSSPRALAPNESCGSDLLSLLKSIQPRVVLICDDSITGHLRTNNRKKFGVGETCVLDNLDTPIVEMAAPRILLRDFREKRRLWKQLVELEAFVLAGSR
jgi:hypothetical protein